MCLFGVGGRRIIVVPKKKHYAVKKRIADWHLRFLCGLYVKSTIKKKKGGAPT